MISALVRIAREILHILYGLYAVVVFVVVGLLAFPFVLLPLRIEARRQIAHIAARTFFLAAGIRVRLNDAQRLPAEPSVVVANHASYLDGIVLKAALPARFCFVIKKEVSRVPLAGLLLRRIGSQFVDRFNRHAGGMDARRILKAADSGQALVFFPEGTFLERPGVGKFHTGAFAIAAYTKMPIVPSAYGARARSCRAHAICRTGAHRHRCAAVDPHRDADTPQAVAAARDLARARIVAASGEPDLIAAAAPAQ
jgi:1-acyl-sn-glycerol-3-phosphate acyltransferase